MSSPELRIQRWVLKLIYDTFKKAFEPCARPLGFSREKEIKWNVIYFSNRIDYIRTDQISENNKFQRHNEVLWKKFGIFKFQHFEIFKL